MARYRKGAKPVGAPNGNNRLSDEIKSEVGALEPRVFRNTTERRSHRDGMKTYPVSGS